MRKVVFLFILLTFTVFISASALSLSQAKSRNPQVKKLLLRAKGIQKDWAKFLVEDMPTIDLMSLDSDSLLADLAALDSILDSIQWAEQVPENYFYTYILPTRVSQEPHEYFRKNHWHELWERVKECKDMQCAAYRINEWAYEEMKYEPTSRWDQSAEQTIRRGIGRCEEMAILFIKACRTMGIPARNAYTPYWPFTNSNHAWVEVWTGDRWHYIGGAEMTVFDGAWFTNSAGRTAIVKGIAWGELDSADVPIYRAENGFTILNLTPNYSDTTGLTVTVLDADGAPAESADVWISVFNFASLRAVSRHKTDNNGIAHFVLGKAKLFVSAGIDSMWDFQILPFTEGDISAEITLTLTRSALPDTSFWLYVRKSEKTDKDTSYTPPEISYVRHDLKLERFSAVPKEVFERLPDSTETVRFLKIIDDSRGNRDNLLSFRDAHHKQHEDILSLWEAMAIKDILLPDSAGWEVLWEQSEQIVYRAQNREIPDSLLWDYTANPRILWEDFENWYPDVWKKVKNNEKYSIVEIAGKVGKIVAKLDTLSDKSYFGGMMNPAQVLRAGTGSRLERLGVFVGAMRTLGIPARIAWDYKAAEYFDTNTEDWIRFEFPKDDDEQRETGVVKALFTDGSPLTEIDYYDDFSIVEIEDGLFDDITPPKEVQDSFIVFDDIATGDYAFIDGWRNAFGSPFVRILPFEVSAAGTTFITVPMGMPPVDMVEPGDLLARKFEKLETNNIKDTRGKKLKDADWQKGTIIIAFFDTEHESSISTAQKLAGVQDVNMLLFIESDSKTKAKNFCRDNELKGRIFYGDKKKLKSILKYRQLPSILLLDNGEASMWSEGLNLNIDALINGLIKH